MHWNRQTRAFWTLSISVELEGDWSITARSSTVCLPPARLYLLHSEWLFKRSPSDLLVTVLMYPSSSLSFFCWAPVCVFVRGDNLMGTSPTWDNDAAERAFVCQFIKPVV